MFLTSFLELSDAMHKPMRFPAAWTHSSLQPRWNRAHGPIAIEFRDQVARLLQVVPASGDVVAAARVAHDGAHPELTAERIRRAVMSGRFVGSACVIGLPFAATRAETMTVENGDDAFIRAIIERDAPLRFGCAVPQIGFIRLAPPESGRVEIAAVVADRTSIESLVDPLIEVGLLPDAAEPSFVSTARACSRVFRREADRSRVRVAVDASTSGGVAMLLVGDRIAYCRSTDDPAHLSGAVASCLHDGLPFVRRCEPATEIRLAGARAEDPTLTAALERACGLPVRLDDEHSTVGTAWRTIAEFGGREDRPWDWTAVLGLALRGAARRSAAVVPYRSSREAA